MVKTPFVELHLVAEGGDEHGAEKARLFVKRVTDFVNAQMVAGAKNVHAVTVEPEEGELFRATVTSDLLDEPHVISERHSENE